MSSPDPGAGVVHVTVADEAFVFVTWRSVTRVGAELAVKPVKLRERKRRSVMNFHMRVTPLSQI
jgi:hypothetical protein